MAGADERKLILSKIMKNNAILSFDTLLPHLQSRKKIYIEQFMYVCPNLETI